jgi:signal transduction histidine kinase
MKGVIKRRWGLTISLVIFIFLVLLVSLLLSGLLVITLHYLGILELWSNVPPDTHRGGAPVGGLLAMIAFSVTLGLSIAWFFSKKALRPIRNIIEATHKVAGGDFNVKLDIHSIYELEELSQSFNKMTTELSSIETLRSDFINSFSHELKTPISSIRGFAKLLKDETLSDKDKQEYLDIIIAESQRLTSLSENILSLANYENLEIIADITDIRLDEQLRKAIIQTEPKWLSKDINVVVETDIVSYKGSADLIQQVLLNLIDNAIKFTAHGGNITVRLTDSEDSVRLIVTDDGIGMDELTKERIFDKFYQRDASRTGVGNGLGLSIVKRIVELCGGQIEVRSDLNIGSEFDIRLPKKWNQ